MQHQALAQEHAQPFHRKHLLVLCFTYWGVVCGVLGGTGCQQLPAPPANVPPDSVVPRPTEQQAAHRQQAQHTSPVAPQNTHQGQVTRSPDPDSGVTAWVTTNNASQSHKGTGAEVKQLQEGRASCGKPSAWCCCWQQTSCCTCRMCCHRHQHRQAHQHIKAQQTHFCRAVNGGAYLHYRCTAHIAPGRSRGLHDPLMDLNRHLVPLQVLLTLQL